jgi:hypothetical protein
MPSSTHPIRRLFQPDHQGHEGVRPINIYALRLFYLLMLVFLGRDAWGHILAQPAGAWEAREAMVWSVWAAFSLLALPGIFHPLRMLPILLLEIAYKGIWLALVAYPLWRADRLAGSAAEGMTYVFLPVLVVAAIVPWGYVVRRYLLGRAVPRS